MSTLSKLHPRHFFFDTWQQLDREAASERASHSNFDARPLIAIVTVCLCLALMEYGGSAFLFADLVDHFADARHVVFFAELRDGRYYELSQLAYWACVRVIGYFVLPALVARLVLRVTLRELGVRIGGFRELAFAYPAALLLMLVVVAVASTSPAFTEYYPFYRAAGRSPFDFVTWELLYVAQFCALEFFFRGFLIGACRRSLGSHAIFVSLIPYCMVHFGKPWPETVAAVLAGLVLGTLAERTRSIAPGCLIHVSVALAMDVASLLRLGSEIRL